MSKFFVGQRVRVARGPASPCTGPVMKGRLRVGDEGTVAGTESRPNAGFCVYGDFNLSVKMDSLPSPGMGPDYCFEPIVAEGAQPSEFTTLHDLLESLEGVAA